MMFMEDLGIIEECLNKFDARIRKPTILPHDSPLTIEEEKVDVDAIDNDIILNKNRKETQYERDDDEEEDDNVITLNPHGTSATSGPVEQPVEPYR